MGRKIEFQETENKICNFCQAVFAPPSMWRPWHVPCLPYDRYATGYESSEPLIEFLRFLVQKLCQNNAKHLRDFLRDLGDFPNYYSMIFAITFQPEMIECKSNPPKTRTIA